MMDPFERRLVADLSAIADGLPPLGAAARRRRTSPLAPIVAAVAVLALATGTAYVASLDSGTSIEPVARPSRSASTPAAPVLRPDDETTSRVATALSQYAGLPGAGVIEADVDTGTVVLHWSGPVPAAVAAEAGLRADGVRVTVVQADYSTDELTRASDALLARYPRSDFAQFGTILPDAQMSGLVVEVEPAWLRENDVDALTTELAETAGVPVQVVARDDELMPPP